MKASAPLSESFAFAYLGIPFKDRGVGREGADCWGLVSLLYRERLGISLPLYPEIETVRDPAIFRTFVRESKGEAWEEIPAGSERAFDVVLMRGFVDVDGRKAGRPIHVGCVVRPGNLIHTEQGVGVSVVNYRTHPSVKHRVISFFRYRHGQ